MGDRDYNYGAGELVLMPWYRTCCALRRCVDGKEARLCRDPFLHDGDTRLSPDKRQVFINGLSATFADNNAGHGDD